MGKASRWIRSLLIGKKEDKERKKDTDSFSVEHLTVPMEILPMPPKVKQRWSFGRTKCTKSSDSIGTTTPLAMQALAELEAPQYNAMALEVAHNNAQHAAATKIQAVFRSYLARKALRALRGLVKLQALFRGHLVRKQMNATLRRMHALMSIQVRARVHRIQMAEEAQLPVQRQSSIHRNFPQEDPFRKAHNGTKAMNLHKKNKNGNGYQPQTEIIEPGFTTNSSENPSFSNIPKHFSARSNHSPVTGAPRTILQLPHQQVGPTDEYVAAPKWYWTTRINGAGPNRSHDHEHLLVPTYMEKTESSRAKVRSQSEPKQRPRWRMRQKTRRRASVDAASVSVPLNVQLARMILDYPTN